jgi:hypothetical protein
MEFGFADSFGSALLNGNEFNGPPWLVIAFTMRLHA